MGEVYVFDTLQEQCYIEVTSANISLYLHKLENNFS